MEYKRNQPIKVDKINQEQDWINVQKLQISDKYGTPLVQEDPSGRSTELTEHGPISH